MGSCKLVIMPDRRASVTLSCLVIVGLVDYISAASQQWRPISRSKELQSNPASQHLIERRTANYGAPSAPDSNAVDLHNKEFCVDVSTYLPVEWKEVEAEQCDTAFVKQCEDREEDVCAEFTETRCQVVPFTECKMGMQPQEYTTSVLEPKLFVEKTCTQGRKMIPHVKMLPECRNVTKTVKFIVPEINCTDGQEVWYHEPEKVTDVRMTNTFNCEVKHSTSCESQTRPDCTKIKFQECVEVPVTNCEPKTVHKPTQEKLHRKKCLLPDEKPAESAPDSYGQPIADPLPSYSGPQ